MTTSVAGARAADTGPVPVARAYRFELVKLLSQWRVRALMVACWIAPAVLVAAVSRQSSLPVDTAFGRWMHATGWAGSLVTLGLAGGYGLPLLTSLVAGDVFALEDRLGTWRHLLVAVRSPRRIFVAKALAALTVVVVLVSGLAASSAAGGILAIGNRSLVGLDGHLISPADAAGTVLLAWAAVLAPTLALAALGLLGSVAWGRSPTGLLLPAAVAIGMQLVEALPVPVAARLALPSHVFVAWHGLFTSPPQRGPLVIGVVVSLAWAVVATSAAYLLFRRRDFTNASDPGSGRRAIAAALAPLVAVSGLAAAVVSATGATGSGIEQDKVQGSLATAFAHLYRLQTSQLHRPDVTEAQLATSASCTKGSGRVAARGPGNDWRCVVTWHLPGVQATGSAIYQLDLTADGRYVADGDGPKEVNGYFLVRTPTGTEPNPLWQFDGTVDLLYTQPKG